MKIVYCLYIFVLLCGFCVIASSQPEINRIENESLVLENIPEIPASIQNTFSQYQNGRSASFAGWVSSGTGMLIQTRFGETQQIHRVDFPGAARTQLTFFSEPVSGVVVSPQTTRNDVLFTTDVGGAENYQIFHLDLDTLQSKQLTDGNSRNQNMVWSNDGSRFAYSSTKRNQTDYDIYVGDIASSTRAEMVLQTKGAWGVLDWSLSDKRLLLRQYISSRESFLYSLDLSTKELNQINPRDERISYVDAKWAADEKHIYLISDQDSQFHELRVLNLETGELITISTAISWDINEFDLSSNGQYIAFTSNEGGTSKLHVLGTTNYQEIGTLPVPDGVIRDLSFSPTEQKLAMTIQTTSTQGDVFVIDIPKYNDFQQWTFSEAGGVDASQFITPKIVQYDTFDSVNDATRQIPAFYYKPDTDETTPHPVLVMIHGGPASQFRPPRSNSFIQYLVKEAGVAVLAPNVRGSSGYGKEYEQLDNGMKREDSVRDIGALLDWIAAQPELDEDRVIVFGGSYGGYMVLASMVHFGERLLAGVELVGISNFVTFLENTKEYRRDLRRPEYGDERIAEMRAFLQAISPLTHADQINKPMFIAQGLNDPRVPASESEQIVNAVRANGTEVWYFLAKDEGHGFRKQSNRDLFYQTAACFIQKQFGLIP